MGDSAFLHPVVSVIGSATHEAILAFAPPMRQQLIRWYRKFFYTAESMNMHCNIRPVLVRLSGKITLKGDKKVATKKFNGFKNILFTTDFSEPSLEAFSYALSMAQNYKAKLTIFHVVDTSSDASGFYLPHIAFENLNKDMEISAMAMLEKAHKRRLGSFKNYKYVVLSGNPHKEIIKYSIKTRVDLVVMGTYGHGAIDRLVFGSTTERVLKKAKCPVLAIHPKS